MAIFRIEVDGGDSQDMLKQKILQNCSRGLPSMVGAFSSGPPQTVVTYDTAGARNVAVVVVFHGNEPVPTTPAHDKLLCCGRAFVENALQNVAIFRP